MYYSKHHLLWTLIFLVSLSRLLPHPPNFTPVMAIALFSGLNVKNPLQAMFVPLLAMLCSDFLVGFHNTMVFVYGAILAVVLALNFLKPRQTTLSLCAMTICSSLFFFLVTNFGSWLSMPGFYDSSISGLMSAYVAGIPFLHNAMAGDLLYVALLFGIYHYLMNFMPLRFMPDSINRKNHE